MKNLWVKILNNKKKREKNHFYTSRKILKTNSRYNITLNYINYKNIVVGSTSSARDSSSSRADDAGDPTEGAGDGHQRVHRPSRRHQGDH